MADIAVIGAGAWGTALAIHAHRAGHRVTLWARDPASIKDRINPRLPGHPIPDAIQVGAIQVGPMPGAADAVLVAVPVRHVAAVLGMAMPAGPLVLCAKGLHDGRFPLEIAGGIRPGPAAMLTGPNFAHEVAAGLPAAAVVASDDPGLRAALLAMLGTGSFRLYGGSDPVGAQVGGAAKNVVAIAAGVAIGAGLGENARAALVTRGLAEIGRLAVSLGGRAATVMGLSGLGDLLLTCTGPASRNFQLGLALGRGGDVRAILASTTHAVEGVAAAPALTARAVGVDLPVIATVAALLDGRVGVRGGMESLLARPGRDE
jgi:glycerol-3-phosphate dehydrogenase (NAD(P)+)